MKKLLTILLLISPAFVFAQTDTTKNIGYEQYCIATLKEKSFSTKLNLNVDFGQEIKYFNASTRVLKDKMGRWLEFKSAVDALNYMASQGWILINAYPVDGVINYVMRKPADSKIIK